MHLHKKMILFAAAGALFVPQALRAATDVTAEQGTDYNITLLSLVGLVLILLFVIGMLANTFRQLAVIVREKNIKEKQTGGDAVKAILFLLFMLSSAHSFAAADSGEFMAHTPDYISGIPIVQFYTIVSVIALELLVIFMLVFYTHILLRIIRGVPVMQAKAAAVTKDSWFWDKFNSATSIEKEKDVLLDHNYDGIMELDNALPPWWKYGFYVTIVVAFIYIYRFHVSHDGQSQLEEFNTEMAQGEADKAEYLAKSANNVDEGSVTLLTSGADIANGKELFVKNCAACHQADGGGTVGPNLTDDYWLHGGDLKSIFKTIKYGWQDKGMKSWKDDLSPKQMQEVASFIKTLKGTHPLTPKVAQGDLYIEAAPAKQADSTTNEKVVKQ